MKLITVTNDQGIEEVLNGDFILGVKARPKGVGSIIKFSNGTSLPVIEEVFSVVKRWQAHGDFESYR